MKVYRARTLLPSLEWNIFCFCLALYFVHIFKASIIPTSYTVFDIYIYIYIWGGEVLPLFYRRDLTEYPPPPPSPSPPSLLIVVICRGSVQSKDEEPALLFLLKCPFSHEGVPCKNVAATSSFPYRAQQTTRPVDEAY